MSDVPAGKLDDERADPPVDDEGVFDEVDADLANRADDDADVDGDDDDVGNRIPGATASEVLEYLVRALVDDPDAVEIDVDEDRRGLRMQVRVGPGDMGRVIGRRGRLANAVRTVVRAAAVPDGLTVDVDFVD